VHGEDASGEADGAVRQVCWSHEGVGQSAIVG
jgi:hypothetical protein